MAEQSQQPSWQSNDSTFTFQQDAPARIPRGWERAPKSPYGSRHGGRKVWKRFDIVAKDRDGKHGEGILGSREATAVLGDTTNTSRSVKRMRVKGGAESAAEGKENKPSKYLATLRDKMQGTPRRKQASRKSLKSDHAGFQAEDTDGSIAAGSAAPENVVHEEAPDEVQDNTLRASQMGLTEHVNTAELAVSQQDNLQQEAQEDTVRNSQISTREIEAAEHLATSKSAVSEDVAQEEKQDVACNEVQEDSLRASQSPALEDVRELLGSASKDYIVSDDERAGPIDEAEPSNLPETSTLSTLASLLDDKEELYRLEETISGRADIPGYLLLDPSSPTAPEHSPLTPPKERPEMKTSEPELLIQDTDFSSPTKSEVDTISPGPVVIHNLDFRSPSKLGAGTACKEHANPNTESVTSILPAATPRSASPAESRRPKRLLDTLSPDRSPQIGTSLLRRESLRSKGTPSKKRELRVTRSPKKKDTLSRRDTLQEREILQKVIAETNQYPSPKNADLATVEASALSSEDLVPKNEQIKPGTDEKQPTANAITGADRPAPTSDDTKVEKDLHRVMEAIKVFEHPTQSDAIDIPNPVSDAEAAEMKAIDKANEMIAEAELEEATQTVETAQEQREQPSRQTRSAARFSDDTSMLRDFLNRAQASKAAKIPVLSSLDAPKPQTSPRRSPRKALRSRRGEASTPPKLGEFANRPGTPPEMPKTDILNSDDAEEITATPSSCRRSTRTRLPAASKPPPGAPSFIPVRRADGADPIVLQKSQAQELAIVTRANTRRNKGQSKPPLLALKDLPAFSAELAIATQRAENAKSVGWAETLASHQDPDEKADGIEEKKPKVRRMRGLGAVNGTPAAKKTTAVVSTLNGTPARRDKIR